MTGGGPGPVKRKAKAKTPPQQKPATKKPKMK